MRVCTIVGARPQFVKAAVVSRALAGEYIEETLVHTGQHYDAAMSQVFFDELDIPRPDVDLGVGSGSHARQTGEMMIRLEQFLLEGPLPDQVLVYGDTNSTLAGALVAAKLNVPLAHVEAGLRSFNRVMPEEVNRIVTDRLSQLLFCPSETAILNLRAEGAAEGVHFTGDVMYDALRHYREAALEKHPLETLAPYLHGAFYLATVHRAENTDSPERLGQVLRILGGLDLPVVWPLHPRTRSRIAQFGLDLPERIHAMPPAGYLAMLSLLDGAARVLTDSGGLQKEAFWMERPCVTLRTETEWVETLLDGWNRVTDLDEQAVHAALQVDPDAPPKPCYGDGHAAAHIASLLARHMATAAQ